jgi:hypothetical protein
MIVGTTTLLSSCLKQSIPDAMLDVSKHGTTTATLSYKVNGNAVSISVNDADNQVLNGTLYCAKYYNNPGNYYGIEGLSSSGEITFLFYTDSLNVGNYSYTSYYGPMYFANYNGSNEYVYDGSDSLSFNVTSYRNGHISGNFSGQLTPMLDPNTNSFGVQGSVLITNGIFENVPVFY